MGDIRLPNVFVSWGSTWQVNLFHSTSSRNRRVRRIARIRIVSRAKVYERHTINCSVSPLSIPRLAAKRNTLARRRNNFGPGRPGITSSSSGWFLCGWLAVVRSEAGLDVQLSRGRLRINRLELDIAGLAYSDDRRDPF